MINPHIYKMHPISSSFAFQSHILPIANYGSKSIYPILSTAQKRNWDLDTITMFRKCNKIPHHANLDNIAKFCGSLIPSEMYSLSVYRLARDILCNNLHSNLRSVISIVEPIPDARLRHEKFFSISPKVRVDSIVNDVGKLISDLKLTSRNDIRPKLAGIKPIFLSSQILASNLSGYEVRLLRSLASGCLSRDHLSKLSDTVPRICAKCNRIETTLHLLQ